jgi:hypothetical protein
MHWIIGVVAIIALPAVSLTTRTGGLAFTMFSGSGSYRLGVVTIDEAGRERRVPPTAIGRASSVDHDSTRRRGALPRGSHSVI